MDIGETHADSRVRWAYFVARKAEGRALWCYLSFALDLEHRIQRIKWREPLLYALIPKLNKHLVSAITITET